MACLLTGQVRICRAADCGFGFHHLFSSESFPGKAYFHNPHFPSKCATKNCSNNQDFSEESQTEFPMDSNLCPIDTNLSSQMLKGMS